MANARSKSEQADHAASLAGQDSDIARMKAKEYAPEFIQPGMYVFLSKYFYPCVICTATWHKGSSG